jgi:hypothetical protein
MPNVLNVIIISKKKDNSMDYDKKIVTHFQITNLWTDKESIFAKRERCLTAVDIQKTLKMNPVVFVVANIGE